MISINSSEKTYVNISVNKTDSGQNNTYRFHYVNYTHSKIISLVDSRIFTFETYENLSLEHHIIQILLIIYPIINKNFIIKMNSEIIKKNFNYRAI